MQLRIGFSHKVRVDLNDVEAEGRVFPDSSSLLQLHPIFIITSQSLEDGGWFGGCKRPGSTQLHHRSGSFVGPPPSWSIQHYGVDTGALGLVH